MILQPSPTVLLDPEPFSESLAQAYLQSEAFAFDIETDTFNYHWGDEGDEGKTDSKRGLSYVADMTHISFAAPGLPPMVLEATWEPENYVGDAIEDGHIIEAPFTRRRYRFTDDEIEFIFLLFTRYSYTAIAHNLVFDARQILGKFGIWPNVPDGARFWDTQVVNLLGRWLEPVFRGEKLPTLEELESYHDILDAPTRQWWSMMKKHRDKLQLLCGDDEQSEKYRKAKRNSPDGVNPWTREEGLCAARRYSAIDSVVALAVYEHQYDPEKCPRYDIPREHGLPYAANDWNELLEIDLEYTKWCAITAARGIKANLPYLRRKRDEYFYRLVMAAGDLGCSPADVFAPRGDKWKEKYVTATIDPPTAEEIEANPYLITKGGKLSFSADALRYYLETHPSLKPLLEYQRADTRYKNADELIRHAEYDGRIHTAMDRRTVTGRTASSTPNLQNQHMNPEAGETTEDTAAGYLIADEGYILIGLDYSNAENWIQAMYAGDNAFARACAQTDFHSLMAESYFGDKWREAKEKGDKAALKRMRSIGKPMTFGVPYGRGPKAIAREMSVMSGEQWTMQQAEAMLDAKNRAYEGVSLAMDKSSAWAKQCGYTILWTGRQNTILKTINKNTGKIIIKGYTAWNSLAQGGVGEIVVRAILAINRRIKDLRLNTFCCLQIHDELVLQLKLTEYELAVPPVIQEMSKVVPDEWNNRTRPPIRWLTDLEHGTNAKKWGYVPGEEYPFPLDTYVNQWGTHRLEEGQTERPVWINQWGYGDRALAIEMGEIGPDEEYTPPAPQPVLEDVPPFDWLPFRYAVDEARKYVRMYAHRDKIFDFPEGIELQRALAHRGQENEYKDILAAFDRLAAQCRLYEEWREKGGGK